MPIYDESKMRQKVVYPTKQTPSYADWALFNMGKELEAHGGAYDPVQDVFIKTVTGVKSALLNSISIEISEEVPVSITYNDTTYALTADETSDAYQVIDETDDSLIGLMYIYGDVVVGNYIGINTDIEGERYCLYGTITEVSEQTAGE